MKKAVIITGVSGDIGRSLAKEFKLSGWFVIGLDIKETKDKANCYYDKFYKFDLSYCIKNPEIFDDLAKNIKLEISNNKHYLYGIINNAAIQIVKPFKRIEASDWINSFSVNLFFRIPNSFLASIHI